ncbi:hypothetical protein LguiB_029889 [Lonicera macranthoides]
MFTRQIPFEITQLTRLESLDLSKNSLILRNPTLDIMVRDLTVLKELFLSEVNISSPLPHGITNLSSLTSLFLDDCGLIGEFPTDIFYLPNLQFLSVNLNKNLTGYLPEFCQNNSLLKELSIAGTSFSGKLPDSIGTLNSLNQLHLHGNYFSGPLPTSLNNLTRLNVLELSTNNFTGQIPSLENLLELNYLSLSLNKFNEVDLPWLGKLSKLSQLYPYDVNLYGEIPSLLANLTQLTHIRLGSNHLSGWIPLWLTNLTRLTSISLGNNQLKGPIPSSFSQLENLEYINLHYNNLIGMVEANTFLGMKNLTVLQLLYNNLTFLTTNTTSMNATYPKLKYLGLSSFNLTEIPDFIRFQDELEVLFLERNEIRGQIPEWIWNKSEETMGTISLSYNFLTGFEHNPVVLPWAGNPTVNSGFSKLRIIDLSNNGFTGDLPLDYFKNWDAMKNFNVDWLSYMQVNITFQWQQWGWDDSYPYSITITNKGVRFVYEKILNILTAIDLSSNKFKGQIPESITTLKGLRLLNLSNNDLVGSIPSSFRNLMDLESLDLSRNKLTGEIPRSLLLLTFLAFFNVSFNGLSGPIPQGKQFNTFQNNSYEGNLGLCGNSLSKKCENMEAPLPPLTTEEGGDYEFPIGFDWVVICMGYGSGSIVGLIIGHRLFASCLKWFIDIFRRR